MDLYVSLQLLGLVISELLNVQYQVNDWVCILTSTGIHGHFCHLDVVELV